MGIRQRLERGEARTLPFPLPPMDRHAIEEQIECLIALLDDIDGDADIEDDELGDVNTRYSIIPRYGVDQTQRPINEEEAREAVLAWEEDRSRARISELMRRAKA